MIYTEDIFIDSRPIPGFGRRYRITRSGDVWSCAKLKWRKLRPFASRPKGTLTHSVSLSKNRKPKTYYIHRLISRVFGIEPLPKGAKLIPRGKGRYAVTKEGIVWSNSATKSRYPGKWKQVAPTLTRDGYYRIRFRFDSKTEYYFLHRLVLETFVGPCPEGMESCHYPDTDPKNCSLKNLRWDIHKENIQDKKR